MNFPFFIKNCAERILCRKKTLIILILLYLSSIICGIIFIKTPAIYEYHYNMCDRFIDRVCFSNTSVFLIFFERTFGNAVLLVLFVIAGIHPIACILPPVVIIYRAYTFGGSIFIFCSVYRFTGVLIAFLLYFPIHLLIDAVFLCAGICSFHRSVRFCFCKRDFSELVVDFLFFLAIIVLICILEAILLLALFHPLGNIL